MNFLNAIRPLYILSRCLATTPYIPSFKPLRPLANRALNIIHDLWTLAIVSLMMTGFVMCVQDVHIKLTENPGQLMSHMFSTPTNFVSSIVDIIVMSTLNRNKILTLLNRMCKIDEMLYIAKHKGVYKKTERYLIIQTLIVIIALVPLICYDIHSFWKFSNMTYEIISKLSVTVSIVTVIQYVNLLKYLKDRLRVLNGHISLNVVTSDVHQQTVNKKSHPWQVMKQNTPPTSVLGSSYIPYRSQEIISNIFKYRMQYNEIFEASQLVNSVYGINILLAMLYCFVSTVTNAYFFFLDNVKNYDKLQSSVPAVDYYIITDIVWVAVALGKAAAISISCHCVVEEMKTLSYIVQKRQLYENLKEDISHNLEKFSYQLSTNKIQFTAFGFFTINLSFLYGFIASSVTYVIVLIQFNFKS
ncbi:hypothetical protein L9F63_023060 [Diploptera punctata]|uniref:Gustatory receptor n=1 Tax=Diploptera punctata TaxID=6984 RepID=A0AAD7ZLM3_DIPPU|nr:hypothetical protein L9F63_023060 [Diploptera punctata]